MCDIKFSELTCKTFAFNVLLIMKTFLLKRLRWFRKCNFYLQTKLHEKESALILNFLVARVAVSLETKTLWNAALIREKDFAIGEWNVEHKSVVKTRFLLIKGTGRRCCAWSSNERHPHNWLLGSAHDFSGCCHSVASGFCHFPVLLAFIALGTVFVHCSLYKTVLSTLD